MTYQLTPSDIQLITDLAGALNTGRALVPPAERFGNTGIPASAAGPSLKWSHADELEELAKRATGPTPPPINPLPPEGQVINAVMPWLADPNRWEVPNFSSHVIVAELTVPNSTTPSTQAGYTSIFEHHGTQHLRHMTLSKTPNDFRAVDPTGANGPIAEGGGVQASINWWVGKGGGPGDVVLKAGETYYFNFKNQDPVEQNFPAMIETNWPHF